MFWNPHLRAQTRGRLAVGCPSQLAGSCSSILGLPHCSGQGMLPGMECLWDNRTWIPAATTNCLCSIRRPRKLQLTQTPWKNKKGISLHCQMIPDDELCLFMQNQRVRQRTEEDRGLQDNLNVGTNKVQEMKHPTSLHQWRDFAK